MKLGKMLGRIGFVVGFVGPLLFYLSPYSLPTYGPDVACPACPHIDLMFATRWTWIEIALKMGLCFGLIYALGGFAVGYALSRFRRRSGEVIS